MALLHRFLRLNDQVDTGIFTFVVTRSVTRDLHRDVTSKEFAYGHNRWALTFSRHDKVLGVYLVWKNPSEGMKTLVDLHFTLLNRHHFSLNENFSTKNAKFTAEAKLHGCRKMVQLSKLTETDFMDRNGEFQLEVHLSNIRSVYEHKFRINQSIFNNLSKLGKLETTYFSYDQYDWSLSVYPSGRSESQLGIMEGAPPLTPGGATSMTVYLNRHTGLDRQCRIRFNLRVGAESSENGQVESGILDEISDQNGKSFGWLPRARLTDCVCRGILKLHVEMLSVNTVSLIEVPILPASPIGLPLYDKDKLAWELEADTSGNTLKFRLIHKDAKNIPKNHIRYVCWAAYMIKRHPKLASALGHDPEAQDYKAKLAMDQKTYFQYYIQDDVEDGTLMDTKIPMSEISDPSLGYLSNRTCVQVHVEWMQSTLLFQATYNHYDDLPRFQAYQMRQDIQNLRLENEVLEQRLASCALNGSSMAAARRASALACQFVSSGFESESDDF